MASGSCIARRASSTLTEAGASFYDSAKRILAEIEEAEVSLGGRTAAAHGTLTVTAPLLFGRLHVASVVVEMLEKHRDVSADLMLVDRNVSLVEEGIDVAVRIGRLDDSALVARSLGEVPRVVCASPAYLRRRGTPKAPDELREHECLRFSGLTPGREWTFLRDGKEVRIAVRGRFGCNVGEPAIDAARAGVGMLMALGYQVAEDLAAGRRCACWRLTQCRRCRSTRSTIRRGSWRCACGRSWTCWRCAFPSGSGRQCRNESPALPARQRRNAPRHSVSCRKSKCWAGLAVPMR